MKICGIYKITSPSKKVYIGQSVDVANRWSSYRNLKCVRQRRLYNSLMKYGVEKHKFEILCQCSREELNNLEVYYIELYQCFNSEFGLNLKEGGGYSKLSDETKRKIGDANRGKKHSIETIQKRLGRKEDPLVTEKRRQKLLGGKLSEETRKRMSESRTGSKHPNYGKKASAETREKQRRAKLGIVTNRKGKGISSETKAKISETLKGKKQSKETKQKRSKSLILAWERRKLKQTNSIL